MPKTLPQSLSTVFLLGLLSLPPSATFAQSTPGFNPQAPTPAPTGVQPPASVSEVGRLLDQGVAFVEDFLQQAAGGLTGVLSSVLGMFGSQGIPLLQDLQQLAQLMVKLVNFPSTIGAWWDGLLDSLTGSLDPCLSEFGQGRTPPFIYEAGWCAGGGSGGGSSGALTDDFELLEHTHPDLAPPAPRQSLGEIVKAASGPAGLPIPSRLRYESDRAVDAAGGDGDRFEVNPTVISHYQGNTIERGAARLQSEAVLGEVGQAKMAQELQGVQQAVTGSFATAGAAQGLSVTQDVMKQMVQMQATETLLTGSLATSQQQLRVDSAFTHLNLTNISRSLDEANRSRRIDRTLEAYKVLRSVSQSTLF